MADLTITNAVPVAGARNTFGDGFVNGAVSVGRLLYRDAADSFKVKLGDTSSAAKAAIVGIALHNASSAGQPMRIQTAGRVTLGTTLVVGMVYVLSGTADGGRLCPVTDVDTGELVTVIGVASTTAILDLRIWPTGIVSASDI